MNRRLPWLLGALAVGLGSAPPALAHKNVVTRFTYYTDALPIFREKCGSCHREGGVAPMSLLSYESAFPWAIAIKTEVLAQTMPPWFADERYGRFEHALSLTAGEMNTLVDWCLGGAPEGEPAGAAGEEPDASSAWPLGEPDAVLEPDAPVTLSAEVSAASRVVLLKTSLGGDRWVRGISIRPEKASALRSAVAEIVTDAEPRLLGVWVAGRRGSLLPDSMGSRLPEGATLRLTLRYAKTWLDEGQEVVDRSTLGLYFARPDARPVRALAIRPEGDPVPSGSGFELRGVERLDAGAELLGLAPELGASLEGLVAEAVRPDGSRAVLLRLHSPSADWIRCYRLETPLPLEAGTRVELTLSALDAAALGSPSVLWLETTSALSE